MGRPPIMGTLFRSVCMDTRADPALAGAAALAQGFVHASEAAANRRRYQTTVGATTYTVITITENYTWRPVKNTPALSSKSQAMR